MKHILITLVAFVMTIKCFSQNVGIGTTTPGSKLTIAGSDNSLFSKNAVIQLTNTAPGANNTWFLRPGAAGTQTPAGGFSIGDKTTNRLVIDSNGNIGVGVNPQFTLEVPRGTSPNGTARFSGTTNQTQFNFGAAENTYISGGLTNSNVLLNFFGSGNVGIGQSNVPFATLDVARGSGQATAYFHGTNQNSMFNFGTTEETYIRGGKPGSDVYINDLNGGKVRVGGNTAPTATLEVSRGNGTNGTAMFLGTSFHTKFNADTLEHTYIQGGKANSNILMNYYGGGNVGIGLNLAPIGSLDVMRGTGLGGTALFRGTKHVSHFNYDTTENTYIRGGKDFSDVYINDNTGGDVKIGGGFGLPPNAALDVSRGSNQGGTALFRGTSYFTRFNSDSTENTYIRGGKAGSDIYLNDINGGDVKIGGGSGTMPAASLDVSRGFNIGGTAILRGSVYNTQFNYGSPENIYIRGGKLSSNIYMNDSTNGSVRIGGVSSPVGILHVSRRPASSATAVFEGTIRMSAFNSGSFENTYIRGGKDSSDVIISDLPNSNVVIGSYNSGSKLTVAKENATATAYFRGTGYGSTFNEGINEATTITGGNTGSPVILNDIPGGKTGIGVLPTITDGVLDVNGRMRIRSGGDITHSAGIWLNNTNNTGLAAFAGMEDDTHVGFWGAGAFRLSVNTTNGALKINGSEGVAGQVLSSNGAGQAPAWKSSTSSLYNNAVSFYQTSNLNLNCNGCFGDMIPSTATSLVLARQSKVLITFSGFVDPQGVADTRTQIGLSVIRASDGISVANDWYKMVAVTNGGSSFSKTTSLIELPPGGYVMALGATQVNGGAGVGTNFGNGVITAIVIEQ